MMEFSFTQPSVQEEMYLETNFIFPHYWVLWNDGKLNCLEDCFLPIAETSTTGLLITWSVGFWI